MEGIENIMTAICQQQESQCREIMAAAEARAREVVSRGRKAAEEEYKTAITAIQKESEAHREHLMSSARAETGKLILAAKQESLDKTCALALDRLCEHPNRLEFMARSAAEAAADGGEVIMNPRDREKLGPELVKTTNALLKAQGRPQSLKLSRDTRDIKGGFWLSSGCIEVDCSFETMVKAQRQQWAAEMAHMLFD